MSAATLTARKYEAELAAAVDEVFARLEREFTAEPLHHSPVPEGTDISNLYVGAELLGLSVTPQGCQVAGVLEARGTFGNPLYDEAAVQLPRRGTKTTSIQMVLLGRCATRPGYRVVSTAQDGTRASQFFANMMRTIEGKMAREGKTPADLGIRIFYHSQGREYIEWLNGSKWWVVKPEASAFRGEAADCMWFDEAGELDVESSADLLGGALPVMDTRDDGQVIVSGTPGLIRAGLFWDYLEQGREDCTQYGILEYSAGDFAEVFILNADGEATDEPNTDLWFKVHPGLACGLTALRKLLKRWETMDTPTFMREYLCIWPPDSTVTALNLTNWAATAGEHLTSPPDLPWGIGWDVAIGGSSAAVAVGWYDENDEPHVQVMKHKPGSGWVAADVAAALLTHRSVPVAYDNIGDNITVAQGLGRMEKVKASHLKRVHGLQLKEVAAATATLAQANDRLELHHAAHKGLDKAVENAAWRESGGSRLFMRKAGAELVCLLACVHALAAAGKAKRKRSSAGVLEPELG